MQTLKSKCYKCCQSIHQEDSTFSGLHVSCFCSWFHVDQPRHFQDIVARTTNSSMDEWTHITSSFFHGKFRKYSAKLGGRGYLLKVVQPELPELPAMEYLCNQLARHLGLSVPDHFFIRFQDELDTFVSENFMQNHVGCNLVHIYRFLDNPKQFSCEGLLHVLEREVKRFDDIHSFVKLTLFDALIGNHDRHGRNLGLIQSGRDFRLAPFYDNPSYLAIEDPLLLAAFHEPRGCIATQETLEPTMKDYVKEWLRLGLENPVKEFSANVDLQQIENEITDSFIAPKRQQAFLKLIQRRHKELLDATR